MTSIELRTSIASGLSPHVLQFQRGNPWYATDEEVDKLRQEYLAKKYKWNALVSGFTDFEDALQYCSAQTIDADCIVTRNKKDLSTSEIPVYELDEFLEMMEQE